MSEQPHRKAGLRKCGKAQSPEFKVGRFAGEKYISASVIPPVDCGGDRAQKRRLLRAQGLHRINFAGTQSWQPDCQKRYHGEDERRGKKRNRIPGAYTKEETRHEPG